MSDTIDLPRVEKLTEPAKRWRIRWHALRPFYGRNSGQFRAAGTDFWGFSIYPSHEIAEQAAIDMIAEAIREKGYSCKKFLGAFPVEGTQ